MDNQSKNNSTHIAASSQEIFDALVAVLDDLIGPDLTGWDDGTAVSNAANLINRVTMDGGISKSPPARDMSSEEIRHAAQRGYGVVVKKIHSATIMHSGWEMDNSGWIVEMRDGSTVALTTNHGGVYPWTRAEVEEKLVETEGSAQSLRQALALWPA